MQLQKPGMGLPPGVVVQHVQGRNEELVGVLLLVAGQWRACVHTRWRSLKGTWGVHWPE